MNTLNCLNCNAIFQSKRSDRLCCSEKCRKAHYRKRNTNNTVNQLVITKSDEHSWSTELLSKAIQLQGLDNTKAFFERQFKRFIDLGR